MLLGFGLVEDVDFGNAVELTFGYRSGEFFDGPYVGLSYKAARKFNLGYLGGGVEFGGYLNQGSITQGLFRASLTYYSPLSKAWSLPYRFLFRTSYTEGIRRYPFEVISIGKEIRGLSRSGIEGDRRLAIRLELVTFLRGSLLGFRFSPNMFYDAAFVKTGSTLLSSGSYYSGLGIGVRIRNENLAFRTIIIRLAYYPDNPVKNGHFGIGFTTSDPDVIRDYEIVKPDVLKY
jgi:hemolysin activation/secretion protein